MLLFSSETPTKKTQIEMCELKKKKEQTTSEEVEERRPNNSY